jgi:hypothetical protein
MFCNLGDSRIVIAKVIFVKMAVRESRKRKIEWSSPTMG